VRNATKRKPGDTGQPRPTSASHPGVIRLPESVRRVAGSRVSAMRAQNRGAPSRSSRQLSLNRPPPGQLEESNSATGTGFGAWPFDTGSWPMSGRDAGAGADQSTDLVEGRPEKVSPTAREVDRVAYLGDSWKNGETRRP